MNIKTVLAHLHSTLDLDARMDQLLLLPRLTEPAQPRTGAAPATSLVVGYDGSANSQAALDLGFCVAHQMQLATQQQVTIHVVYIVDCQASPKPQKARRGKRVKSKTRCIQTDGTSGINCGTAILSKSGTNDRNLEEIDRVLWQARCLAEEWRGSFTTHLRFGNIADELATFVTEENAALLFLGCHSVNHPLVQQLKDKLPCSVIGIPQLGPVPCPV